MLVSRLQVLDRPQYIVPVTQTRIVIRDPPTGLPFRALAYHRL